ncbi:hypothetical protein OESDEN_03602 [Oesophagostomum dentatum]|uniref:Kringle-like domain-containing protein n=1 Tax=Oesophagostomum dentatum TaxID=61180 RepID=A0A0B1TLZ7_OESDE|nr:hypothetical protein OESDEN_03602 [Oesophagostomum dentatum]
MLHNKCRRLELPPNHPLKSVVSMTDPGPWCYIKRNGKIAAEKCFKACTGEPHEEKTPPPAKVQYGSKQVLKNYNDVLIENIRKYYRSYSWGDPAYYRWVRKFHFLRMRNNHRIVDSLAAHVLLSSKRSSCITKAKRRGAQGKRFLFAAHFHPTFGWLLKSGIQNGIFV